MASYRKRKSAKHFHIFNCDKTCNLDQVKSLLRAVEKNVDFKIIIKEQSFWQREMSNMVEQVIPSLTMDYAVLVVHANDSLPFTEDGYGKLYKAITQKSPSGRFCTFQLSFLKRYVKGIAPTILLFFELILTCPFSSRTLVFHELDAEKTRQ